MLQQISLLVLFFALPGTGIHAQGNLQFNRILLISSTEQAVPTGKVWKVTNAFVQQVPRFTASSGSGSCPAGSCNGSTTRWTSFSVVNCPDISAGAQLQVNGTAVTYNTTSDLWLPEGTTVRGNEYSCISSSTGFFSGTVNGVSYNCVCPPNTPITSTVSVIEFNVVE